MVPLCHGATVPWCLRATVPWCLRAMLPQCLAVRCHGAMVPWCHGALVHSATVPWCHSALVPWCLGAFVPWCLGVMAPLCFGSTVSAQFGTVTRLLVHPASPVLLIKNSPLGALDSVARLDKASAGPTPKSDERFACQYHYGPPPEFPLASPRSGIVHHLLGPDRRVEWGATDQYPLREDTKAHRRRALLSTIEETAFHKCIESPVFGRPQSMLVHAPSRSTDWIIAIPHLIGAHPRPPSASLTIILSTL
ncbi:hypothetical protein T459_34626 [Capsicum annuum]|uniref:Uncharacterized protein n=1 Tax=Capsicum annuum TaxID=4072 RepID=A0A2G2XVI0_CAPAN|nr:hypothetical protein T459_34626 [Capsicum annuum]